MEKETISDQLKALGEDGREYARLHLELLKLELTENTARIFATITTLIVLIGFGFFALLFIAILLWFVCLHITGSFIWASVIIAILYIILGFLVFVFRKKWILNPLINVLSGIIRRMEKKGADNGK